MDHLHGFITSFLEVRAIRVSGRRGRYKERGETGPGEREKRSGKRVPGQPGYELSGWGLTEKENRKGLLLFEERKRKFNAASVRCLPRIREAKLGGGIL